MCHFIYFCIEFPPMNITLEIKRKENKFKIPYEIIACWSSVFFVYFVIFLKKLVLP